MADFSDIKLFFNGEEQLRSTLEPMLIAPALDPGVGEAEHMTGLGLTTIATAEALKEVLSRIEWRGALSLLKARIVVITEHDTLFAVAAGIWAPHRDHGGMTEVWQSFTLPKPARLRDVLYAARDHLGLLLLHEVAEGITIAGIRPFDPHSVRRGGKP